MSTALLSILFLAALVTAVLLGRWIRRHLPDHHLSSESKDAVKLAMGLVATMTALLLGLLVSSAKGTYDTQRNLVIQMASKITFLDRVLAAYGSETGDARSQLRNVVADGIRRLWPEQTGAPAQAAPNLAAGDSFYAAIQKLAPQGDGQRSLKAQASTLALDLAHLRMLLLAQMAPSIPKVLLISVFCWLLVIFLSFSLLAPPNATTTLALIAAATSVAAAVFLILELDQPLGGLIRISSDPLVNAMSQLAN